MLDDVTLEDVDCLVRWPPNSVGEAGERKCLTILLHLCKKHGYGRIPQLANQINEIWNNSESKIEFQKSKEEYFKLMGILK